MEDDFSLEWIFFGERLLCPECLQKLEGRTWIEDKIVLDGQKWKAVTLFEENEAFISLWDQFAKKRDIELAPVFLDGRIRLAEKLQDFWLVSGDPAAGDREGWDPAAELFAAAGIRLHSLFFQPSEEENPVPLANRHYFSDLKGMGRRIRPWLFFVQKPTDEKLSRMIREYEQAYPGLKPAGLLFLFSEQPESRNGKTQWSENRKEQTGNRIRKPVFRS